MRKVIYQLFLTLTFALSAYPIWNERAATYVLTAWLLTGLINFFANELPKKENYDFLFFIGLPSLFLLILGDTIFDSRPDWKYLERSWSLILIPLIYFLNQKSSAFRPWKKMLLVFAFSSVGKISWAIIMAFRVLFSHVGKGWATISDMFNDPWFFAYFRTTFENKSVMHPTYAGFYLAIACIFSLYELTTKNLKTNRKHNICCSFLLIFSFLLLALLAARAALIFCILGLCFILFVNIKSKKYLVITSGVFISIIIGSINFIPSLNQRMKEIKWTNIDMKDTNKDNSFYLRYGIYNCTIDILQQHGLTGVGISRSQNFLDKCYDRYPKGLYDNTNYNTHNQFFGYWLYLGIPGLIVFIFSLGYPLFRFIKHRHHLGIAFLILFGGLLITENMLERQGGIIPGLFVLFLLTVSTTVQNLPNENITSQTD